MAAQATGQKTGFWQNQKARGEALTAYLFLAPYLIITLVFTVGLLVYAVYLSFTRFDLFTPPEWRGITNYIESLTEPRFLRSLYNVAWYSLIVTPVQTFLAILMAVLLNAPIAGKRFFRTVFYAPSVTSSVVISMIFIWLYNRNGFINYGLSQLLSRDVTVSWLQEPRGLIEIIAGLFGGTIAGDQWWLRGPSVALMAIMAMNIFTTAPTFMIMFLAALQDIPGYVYEAAALDGSYGAHRFFNITLPLLRPVILLVVVLSTIGTFQLFDQALLMTAGGPLDTTLTPTLLIYNEALGKAGPPRMGLASAMAFVLGAIIFIFTFIQRHYIESGTEQI